jgi:hypothetical protein
MGFQPQHIHTANHIPPPPHIHISTITMKFTSAISAMLLAAFAQSVTADLLQRSDKGTGYLEFDVIGFANGTKVSVTRLTANLSHIDYKVVFGSVAIDTDVLLQRVFIDNDGDKITTFGKILSDGERH